VEGVFIKNRTVEFSVACRESEVSQPAGPDGKKKGTGLFGELKMSRTEEKQRAFYTSLQLVSTTFFNFLQRKLFLVS
jgi:hypothetical protein